MKSKRKVTKRIAAWLMCLAMVLTTVNLPAFTTEVKAAENITTWAELKAAMENATEPTTIVLTQDIVATAEDTYIKPAATSIILDLNGYMIDRNLSEPTDYGYVFYMDNEKIDLTIKDSSPAKTGVITGAYTTERADAGCIALRNGTLTLLGGTITGNKTLYYGGGIEKLAAAKLVVGGTAKVIGNYAYEMDIKQWNSDIHFNDNVLDGFSFATGDDALVTEGEHKAQFGIRFWTDVDIAPELWTLPSYEAGSCFVSNNQREKYRTSVEEDDGEFLLCLTVHDHAFDDIKCTSACELCGMVREDGIHNMKGEGCTLECSYCHIKVHSNDTYDSKGVCPECKAHRVDDETLLDYQGVRYRLKIDSKLNTYAEVYAYADDIKESIVIPKTIATSSGVYSVDSFAGRCFSGCTRVKDVDCQAEVTVVANNTFEGCSSLASINLPEGLTTIGSYAFDGCSSLTDVTIPSSVINVDGMRPPFEHCSSDKLVITVPCTEYLNTVTPTQWGNIKEINRIHDFAAEEAKGEALKSAATCLDKAVYYRSCSICGRVNESDGDVFEYGSALGHAWGEYHLDGDQTCTYDGHKTAECTREGCSEENKIVATGAALGHYFQSEDIENHKCSVCGEIVAHNYENNVCTVCHQEDCRITGNHDFIEQVLPDVDGQCAQKESCTQKGIYKEVCKDCHALSDTLTFEVAKLSHQLETVAGTAKTPTCTDKGKEADKKCKNCTYVETGKDIAAKGHSAVTDKAIAETCGKVGKTEGSHCSVCSAVIKAQTEVPATEEHTWDGGKVIKKATLKETGKKIFTCKTCGKTKEETIAKLKSQKITVDKSVNKKVTVKAKNLTKNKTYNIKAKAKTSVSYKVTKTPKKASKYITVSKKGAITLKKKAPKGTYEITITAKETAVYGKATKKVTIAVK